MAYLLGIVESQITVDREILFIRNENDYFQHYST
mgnify:CR=1 FL=1